MAKDQALSPAASGGSGPLRVQGRGHHAHALAARVQPPGLLVHVVGVGLQQRARGHCSMTLSSMARHRRILCTEFQVRRNLTATAGDEEFVDVITQALHRLSGLREDPPPRSGPGLGLIAEGQASALDQLAESTRYARGHAGHQTFADVFVKRVVDEKLRTRLENVQAAVALALEGGAPDLGGVDLSAHALLSMMHVWRPSAGDDGNDSGGADRLTPIAESFDVTPIDLFGHLAGLAESWGPVAGVVDANSVLRQWETRAWGCGAVRIGPGRCLRHDRC